MATKLNPNLERAKYRFNLQQNLLDQVYIYQKKSIAEKMAMYAIKNQNILDANTNTFIFDGHWFTAGDSTRAQGDYKPNRELHPDIKEKIICMFNSTFELKVQETLLLSFFGNAINISNTVADLLAILPYPLHDCISMLDTKIFNSGQSLNEQQIQQFKNENQEAITMLSSMLLLELLMSK